MIWESVMNIYLQSLPPDGRPLGLGHVVRPGLNYWQALTIRYEELVAAGKMDDKFQAMYDTRMAIEGIVYRIDESNHVDIKSGEEKLVESYWVARERGLEWYEDNALSELRSYDVDLLMHLNFRAQLKLEDMQLEFDEFKQQLAVSLPELVGKNFGFTVNEHGSLEITSPDGVLTEREIEQLNAWINDRDRLKELTFDHAKLVTYILKHDPRLGVDDSLVTLANIHQFINYGVLLQTGAIRPGNGNSWIEQLQKNVREMTREQKADRESEDNHS